MQTNIYFSYRETHYKFGDPTNNKFFGEGVTLAQLRQIYPDENEPPVLHVKRMTIGEIVRFYDQHRDNYQQFTYPLEYPTTRQWTDENNVVHEVRIHPAVSYDYQPCFPLHRMPDNYEG